MCGVFYSEQTVMLQIILKKIRIKARCRVGAPKISPNIAFLQFSNIKMHFDILEIQKTIEEKRLIWGQKLERFLFNKLSSAIYFLKKISQKFLSQSNSTFIICALTILSSIFIRSARDIGPDSAIHIDIAQKILQGSKYYYDFFENNFPFVFYLTTIPVFAAKIFSVSPIIALEIFVNLVGILAIYFSAIILRKAEGAYSRGQIQLLIICFCIGYFLRIYALQFNEYGDKTSYFLALAFPYISYQIARNNSRSAQLISGILAGLIICLKPHYALLPIVFELSKLRPKEKNFLSPLFCKRNSVTLFLVLSYLVLMLKFTPEYFAFLPEFPPLYFDANYFHIIQKDIFPLLLLSAVALPYISRHQILKPLFCASIASILIIIFELIGDYEQRTIFFSLSGALIAAIVFFLLQEKKINWKRDGILILILLLPPQFDAKSFFEIALNSCYLWWIILFIDKKADRCLFIFAFITIVLIIFDKSGEISWLFSALIFLTLFKYPVSFLAKKSGQALHLPRSSVILISLALSYFISLFSAAIFNQQNLYAANLKSPNYLNENKAFFIAKYAQKNDDEITFVVDEINASYPISTYFSKTNSLPSGQFKMLYKNIYESGAAYNENKASSHLLQGLKAQISKKNNRLIFIERKNYYADECRVGFLEYYFQDAEFKEDFVKNYIFINEIKTVEKDTVISDLATRKNKLEEREVVLEKIEVYGRK